MSDSTLRHAILLGTHTSDIYALTFGEEARTLEVVGKKEIAKHPSWLTQHPTQKDIVYSNGHVDGKVFCLKVDLEGKGGIEILDEAISGGKGPTHLAVSRDGQSLLIAHYGSNPSGFLAALPLHPSGRFAATTTPPGGYYFPTYPTGKFKHPRLDAAHVHQIVAWGEEVLAVDLGSNVVWRLVRDGEGWEVKGVVDGLEDGDGPRHIVVHPTLEIVYVLNEVSSSLTVHTLPSSGSSKLLSRHTILPAHDQQAPNSNPDMTASEVIFLPPLKAGDKSLLIASNRFSTSAQGDALALFSVREDGTVERTEEGWFWPGGNHLRGLTGDDSGRWVITAGRDGGGVILLERVGDGLTLKEVAKVEVDSVVAPLWLSQ